MKKDEGNNKAKSGQHATSPMKTKEDVKNSPDHKTDDDFKDFPGGESKESIINPKTPTERKTAQVDKKKAKNTSGPS